MYEIIGYDYEGLEFEYSFDSFVECIRILQLLQLNLCTFFVMGISEKVKRKLFI